MLYISPIQESICRNGVATGVLGWAGHIEGRNNGKSTQLSTTMRSDVTALQTQWLPEDNARANLTMGFRKNIRYVFAYNGNQEIAMYMKFRIQATDVHLDWVVGKPPTLGRVDCGGGAKPLPCLLAFMGTVGHTLNLPVQLQADTDDLVVTYGDRGFRRIGTEGLKPLMELAHADWQVPQTRLKANEQPCAVEGQHWQFGGEATLLSYLQNGMS